MSDPSQSLDRFKSVVQYLNAVHRIQGMNCNERVVTEHVKYEPTTYNAAYFIEIEAASSPMWSLIAASSVLVSFPFG